MFKTNALFFDLVKIKTSDLNQVVRIHQISFPNFFLTQLGSRVLMLFYKGLINDPNTISWGIRNKRNLVGFFVASSNPKGLYKRIVKKNMFLFFVYLGYAFLKSPKLIVRMLISLKSQSQLDLNFQLSAALLSICVDPSFSGNGAGKFMLQKLDNEFAKNNVINYYLTTDAEGNDATNAFYKRNNFELKNSFYQGQRKMNLYIKEIS